jgi:hypothetical protein
MDVDVRRTMSAHHLLHWHLPLAFGWMVLPFFAWRVVVRLRRLLLRQRFSLLEQYLRVAGLSALVVFVAIVAFAERAAFWSLVGGLAAGALFGALGVRLTQFDPHSGVTYFKPNRWLGMAFALLLLGRIGWRLWLGPDDPDANWSLDGFVRNPSTMVLFGLFSAHLWVYALGIIYWTRRGRLHAGRPMPAAAQPPDA